MKENLLKDIAELFKKYNLGVSVTESEGKLIIEPMNNIKEDDLPIDTPVMVSDNKIQWYLRYYAKCKMCYIEGNKSTDKCTELIGFSYIIPFDKFNPNDINETIKYNIV